MIQAIGKFTSSVTSKLELNKATLSGCLDIIVVEQPDKTLASTPFFVRFGKLKVVSTKSKTIRLEVNGEPCNFVMKLGRNGEAYFEEKPIDKKKEIEESLDESDDEGFSTPPEDESDIASSTSKKSDSNPKKDKPLLSPAANDDAKSEKSEKQEAPKS